MAKAQQFGHYELISRLGRGGMGEVWRAKHKMLNRQAAVKLIRPDTLTTESGTDVEALLRRFEREAQVTSTLKSPHTIEVYDFGITDDGTFYYAMELLKGLDLQTLVDEYGPLPSERVIYALLQVCDSLAEAHHHKLIHRDLKPANVFLTRRSLKHDVVKVLDFGLVKSTGASASVDSRLTITGVIVGSPAFMSPEMIKGKATDERADIYSLGCIAYLLLTGRLVFEARTTPEILAAHLEHPPDPPSTATELEIPSELEQIVMACLRKERSSRPSNAQALAQQLIECPVERPWDEDRAEEWWKICRPLDLADEVEGPEDVSPAKRAVLPRGSSLKPPNHIGSRHRVLISGAIITLAVVAAGILFMGNRHLDFAVDWFSREQRSEESQTLALPTGPVIAVLPFANLSGDPSQEFFADGISEEIITALTRFDEIFILARNTTFQFKGQAVDVRQVGRELGASYVVEGSVQRAEDRVRVTAQLLDAEAGTHLWAEIYDRDLSTEEIFDVMNDITSRVVGAIADAQGVITRAEGRRSLTTAPDDLAAYECVLKAHAYWVVFAQNLHAEVRACLESAVEREPSYAEAWAWLSMIATDEYRLGFNPQPRPLERAMAAASEAVRLAPDSEVAYQALAFSLYYSDDLDGFFVAAEKALELNPNNAQVIASLGLHFVYAGKSERGLALIHKAIALNPQHPGWYYFPSMYYYYGRGEYEQALAEAKKLDQDVFWRPAWLTAIHGQLGRGAEARSAIAELLRLYPTFPSTVRDDYKKWFKSPPEGLDSFLDGLRKAGLEVPPEEPGRD